MINLMTLPAVDAERIAYAEGFAGTAKLFARIVELEVERDALARELEELEVERDALARELEELEESAADDSLARWERDNGPADAYKQFFEDCFERLAGHYPCPSVTSDYDQSVIFAAIEKGEGGAE